MDAFFGGKAMKDALCLSWQEEEGQDLVEQALQVVMVALGAAVAIQRLASAISDAFHNTGQNLAQPAS